MVASRPTRTSTTTDVNAQNCNDPCRTELANNYAKLFEGSCTPGNGCTQVWHAFRRNDESGTTDVFIKSLAGFPGIDQQNNYTPFCGGVTISVETLRRGLEDRGHEAWVLAPRFPGPIADPPRVLRYPSIPAATYPEFPLAIPFARAIAARVRALAVDVFHAHHPFLLGPAAARLARRLGRPLVFTYHTRYEKYAHYVPFSRAVVERAAVALSARFARRAFTHSGR